jgi:uncharacterized protein (TIGR04255 family)
MVRTLPDYDDPPAIETAVGVKFSPIVGWNAFHYGLLLQEFLSDYPMQELRPPLGNVMIQIPGPEENFPGVPVRCWFINEQKTELVQVQSDCFIRNWRKTEESPNYLHYDFIRPRFKRDWERFSEFLEKSRLRPPDVWQCEVSYINQFVRGREWNSFDDLQRLYPIWANGIKSPLLARAQMVTFAVAYTLPNDKGTIQFVSQPGIRKTDGAEIIQLAVTALGRPDSSDISDILSWLDLGRAAVVQGFTDFTSDTAHLIWGKK